MPIAAELWNPLVLTALRVGGLLLIAPLFSARAVPARMRAGLLVLLTLLLLPVVMVTTPAPQLTAATALAETLIGFTIGFGAAVLIGAAEVAGDAIAIQTGLSSANALDPFTSFGTPTVAQFMQLFAVTLVLASGGHVIMIDAVAASLELLPPGSPVAWEHGVAALVRAGSILFTLGLQFAAPILAAALIGNISLGVLARAAPQMNMLAVAFPMQIGLGLLVLSATLPFIASFFISWDGHYTALVSDLLRTLQPGH